MTEPFDPKSLFFKTPEKQEGPNNASLDECKFCDDSVGFMCDYHGALAEIGNLEAKLRSRDAEVADLKAFTAQQTKGTLALIEDNGKLEAELKSLKAEVARFSRDANYWKWCNGCGSAKEDCEKWKDAGKVACCPECNHWPWNR